MTADESVDNGIIKRLRGIGIDVLSISEHSPGIDDVSVLQITVERNTVLITEDKDFGELVYCLRMKHKGILLIRMNDIERKDRLNIKPSTIKDFFTKL